MSPGGRPVELGRAPAAHPGNNFELFWREPGAEEEPFADVVPPHASMVAACGHRQAQQPSARRAASCPGPALRRTRARSGPRWRRRAARGRTTRRGAVARRARACRLVRRRRAAAGACVPCGAAVGRRARLGRRAGAVAGGAAQRQVGRRAAQVLAEGDPGLQAGRGVPRRALQQRRAGWVKVGDIGAQALEAHGARGLQLAQHPAARARGVCAGGRSRGVPGHAELRISTSAMPLLAGAQTATAWRHSHKTSAARQDACPRSSRLRQHAVRVE